ncbi:MAG: ThiF family adenylyltransferase [Rhodopseudomonas palustris]|nr:ThiF family adenylyltransferase [Rhodopseudomonas palustris]
MKIVVNEIEQEVPAGSTAGSVRDQFKPEADLLIVNGFPAETGQRAGGRRPAGADPPRRGARHAEELDALLAARHTPGVHARVKQATVGIAGVGGLGSAVAIALARTGVGRLIIADFDLVEPSNLNRQQYFLDQLGQPKVYALRDTLARINPHVHVAACHLRLTPENIAEIFGAVGYPGGGLRPGRPEGDAGGNLHGPLPGQAACRRFRDGRRRSGQQHPDPAGPWQPVPVRRRYHGSRPRRRPDGPPGRHCRPSPGQCGAETIAWRRPRR